MKDIHIEIIMLQPGETNFLSPGCLLVWSARIFSGILLAW